MKKGFFKGMLLMARPPFHIVGVLPFILGAVLAYRAEGVFSWTVFAVSTLAVIAIMLSTYYNGEYHDVAEDRFSALKGDNPFSGGSKIIVEGKLPARFALIASLISILIAAILGLLLQLAIRTGPLTIPLGFLGILCGFFYSSPPFRWVSRGVGELIIGFCYGWLPINVSYYLQTGSFHPLAGWMSIPIGLSIFNVILINEFPDYDADRMAAKRNLAVRLGLRKSRIIYTAAALLFWASFMASLFKGIDTLALYIALPFLLASLAAAVMLNIKKYGYGKIIMICGLSLAANIGVSLSYILAVGIKGVS